MLVRVKEEVVIAVKCIDHKVEDFDPDFSLECTGDLAEYLKYANHLPAGTEGKTWVMPPLERHKARIVRVEAIG